MKKLNPERIEEIWKITLAQLEIKIDSPAYFKTWFSGTRLKDISDGQAIICVSNSYAINWIKRKDNDLVKETVSYVAGMELEPEYIYEERIESDVIKISRSKKNEPNPVLIDSVSNKTSGNVNLSRSGLNSKYSFKNFIVGTNNRLAHAAALAIADNPGNAYNPFFVHGPTGVGKTHLMQAIGLEVLDKNPNRKVLYTSSEEFLNEMVAAIRSNNGANFRSKYRRLDLLIIDDIQFISKWVETQNELFHTFNTLYQDNKQIIFASDRPPEQIKNLEDRLLSRFRGGMVADIGSPDFEHRLAIIRQKAQNMNLELSDVIENYLAGAYVSNIREIEGALSQIALIKSVSGGRELSVKEVEKVIGMDPESKRKNVKVKEVIKTVANYFGVEAKEILGPKRTALVVFPRQVSMYILREEFQYPLEQVAQFHKRKDHTTVIHAVDKIKSRMIKEPEFRSQIRTICHDITG